MTSWLTLVEPVLIGVENELEWTYHNQIVETNNRRRTLPPVGWYGLGVLVLFAITQVLSSKPNWISGSESMERHCALLRLGSFGAATENFMVPRMVPMSVARTGTSLPFQVTRRTAFGATMSNVVVALRSPCSARVLPLSVALRTRYGPKTKMEGASGERSYRLVVEWWTFQTEYAVRLSTTKTLEVPTETTVMPEGLPVMMTVPFDARALMDLEPDTLTLPVAPETTVSTEWAASA